MDKEDQGVTPATQLICHRANLAGEANLAYPVALILKKDELQKCLIPLKMAGMKSRRTFLLLEMLIALSIMAGALSLLFIGFYGTIRAKNTLKSDKERIIERERLRLRFAILFKKVICVKESQDEGYYIRYQGDVESDPHFRSEIEAFLRVENKILKLTCWPPSGTPREEILSTNISTITLQFFDAKAGQFLESYPNTKPFMMKVILNDNPIPLFL